MADEYASPDAAQVTDGGSDADTEQINQTKLVAYWLTNIDYAEKKVKAFRRRGEQITRRYKNMRSTAVPTVTNITVGQRRMNVLWANVQTLKPVLFAMTPKANVSRRNKDKDPVGRWASIVLQRTLTNSMDMQPFNHVLDQDVESLLLPGYAASMVEYVPEIEGERLGWQEARLRYVHWKDQLTNPARYWGEVWWWGYVSYLTRQEVTQTYGKQIGMEIALDHKIHKDADDAMSKATVWCIWDSKTKKVIHVSTGYNKAPLGVYDPPVAFDDFFPIPRPLVATTATDSTIPVPDFDQYQDQADEIDLLTQRIYVLTRSLKLRGLYPADMESVRQIMDNSSDSDLVPVENWAMLGERGGSDGLVVWFPLDMVAKTIEWCYTARDKAIEAMYEVTGIADIVRGQTDPTETLGAQQLKAQFSGVRVRDRQRDVQRYIREILRHMASVIGQHFTQEVLQKMSGAKLLTIPQKQAIQAYQQRLAMMQQQYQAALPQFQAAGQQPPPFQPPQPAPTPEMMQAMNEPSWEEVMDLLRNEKLRGFIIDVETDSTVEADQNSEKANAVEFIEAVTKFMQGMGPIVAEYPNIAPLVGELLLYGVRRFKAGETLETEIEEAVEQLQNAAAGPKPPSPEQVKAQAAQVKAQTDMAKNQATVQTTQIKAQAEVASAQTDLEAARVKAQAEAGRNAVDAAHQQVEMAEIAVKARQVGREKSE